MYTTPPTTAGPETTMLPVEKNHFGVNGLTPVCAALNRNWVQSVRTLNRARAMRPVCWPLAEIWCTPGSAVAGTVTATGPNRPAAPARRTVRNLLSNDRSEGPPSPHPLRQHFTSVVVG